MTCTKIPTAGGVMFICSRGRKPKPKKPEPVKYILVVSARHGHRAESKVHLSVLTGKKEPDTEMASVWGPSKIDPRYGACRVCGKAKSRYGRPPGKKAEIAEKESDQCQMSF